MDSGGAGLLAIAEGMRDGLAGQVEDVPAGVAPESRKVDLDLFTEDSTLEFGYCTEFLLRLQRAKVDLDAFDERVLSDWLAAHGESLVFFREGSIIKVHVHTFTPGEILNLCQQYGEFLTVKIENTTLQHHENHMESRDLLSGSYDVVVADGFSGNVLVKTTEGTALELLKKLKKNIHSRTLYKLGALLMKRMFLEEKEFMNYQNYGGSVLLGTSKVVVKGHGSSKAVAVEKCIDQACRMEAGHLSERIGEAVAKYEHFEE